MSRSKKSSSDKTVPANPAVARRLGDISNENRGRWVLAEATGFDEDGYDVGYVLAISEDREPLEERLSALLRAKQGRYALFLGRHSVSSGPELEAAARKLVKEFYEAKEAARRAGG